MNKRTAISIVMVAVVLSSTFSLAGNSTAEEIPRISVGQAIERAIENDVDLRQRALDLEIARLELEAAEAMAYVPSIGFSIELPEWTSVGWATDLTGNLSANLPLPWMTGRGLTTSLGLGVDLSDGFELSQVVWEIAFSETLNLGNLDAGTAGLDVLRSAVESAERALDESVGDLVRSVLTAYADLLGLRLQSEIDSTNAETVAADRIQVERNTAEGYASENDLLEAEIRLLEAEIQAERSLQVYETALESFSRETLGIEGVFKPIEIALDLDALLVAAASLTVIEEIPPAVIYGQTSVQSALDRVVAAEEALTEARADALPQLSLDASVGADQWRIGFGLSFDLFAPDRSVDVEIAETELELAHQEYEAAWMEAENTVIRLRQELHAAIDDIELLRLEIEKWTLEEPSMAARYEAGLISAETWDAFGEELEAFRVDAIAREMALLDAYLTYREALGLELDWEGWLT